MFLFSVKFNVNVHVKITCLVLYYIYDIYKFSSVVNSRAFFFFFILFYFSHCLLTIPIFFFSISKKSISRKLIRLSHISGSKTSKFSRQQTDNISLKFSRKLDMTICMKCQIICLFVLRFYGPVNPMGSCRARSVYLATRLLGRLSPLSG